MSAYDEKQYFDLLQPFRSEETRRARRNLSFIAFTVIAAQLLGLRMSDLKPFGMDFSNASMVSAIALGLAVITYRAVMFRLSTLHDKEMQIEKTQILEDKVRSFQKQWSDIEDRKRKNPTYFESNDQLVKAFLAAYENQRARTEKASLYGKIVNEAEHWVPGALFLIAVPILIYKLCVAL